MNFLKSIQLYDIPDYEDYNGMMIDLNGLIMRYIVLDVDDDKANKIVIQHCKENNYNLVSTPSYSNINKGLKYKNHYWFKQPNTNITIKKKVSVDHPEMLEQFGLLDIIIQIAEHKDSTIDFKNISEISEESLKYFYMLDDEEEEEEAPKEEVSEDKITDLLKILKTERGNGHTEFLTIGSALKAIDKDFVTIFDIFCKKKDNYKGSKDIIYKWKSFPKNQGIGTLINMAKQDNLEKYKRWRTKWCKDEMKEEKEKNKELKEENDKLKELVNKDEYTIMKEQLEKRLFLVEEPILLCYINDDNKANIYSEKDMRLLLNPYKIGKKYFFDMWKEDKDRKTYKKMDFLPNNNDTKIYNLFTGFKYNNDKPINYTKIQPFLDLINELLNNEEVSINIFLDWCAWIRQRPEQKTEKAVVLYSEVQGVGKNTIIQLLTEVYGYSSKIEKIEELTDKFNMHLANKLFVYGDEIQAKARELREELKNMITRTEMKVELKGVNSYISKDFTNYIFTSNNKEAFFIEATDRRFYLFNLENKLMSDDVAINLYSLLKDKETFESFDTYLKNRPLPDRLGKLNNKYKKDLINNSLPAGVQMIYRNPNYYDEETYRITTLFRKAQEYAKTNGLHWTFSQDKFSKDFKAEFSEFYFKGKEYNYYKFPEEQEFIKILKTKREELLLDYI